MTGFREETPSIVGKKSKMGDIPSQSDDATFRRYSKEQEQNAVQRKTTASISPPKNRKRASFPSR
jgi:hypothetical protein